MLFDAFGVGGGTVAIIFLTLLAAYRLFKAY